MKIVPLSSISFALFDATFLAATSLCSTWALCPAEMIFDIRRIQFIVHPFANWIHPKIMLTFFLGAGTLDPSTTPVSEMLIFYSLNILEFSVYGAAVGILIHNMVSRKRG